MFIVEHGQNIANNTVIALGTFDGLHLAHMAIIRETVKIGHEKGLQTAVHTFSNHPRNIINKSETVLFITPPNLKKFYLGSEGIDYLIFQKFDEVFMRTNYIDFFKHYLIENYHEKHIVTGFHHRFGYKAEGYCQLLLDLGEKYNVGIKIIPQISIDAEIVSSSKIRELIKSGDMEKTAIFLGRPFAIMNKVTHGQKIGRTLGFRTINLTHPESVILPPNGVYVTQTLINSIWHLSVTNIGYRPTIKNNSSLSSLSNQANESNLSVETHILDIDMDLYDENVIIQFFKRLRAEIQFSNLDELKSQINDDIGQTRQYFSNNLLY